MDEHDKQSIEESIKHQLSAHYITPGSFGADHFAKLLAALRNVAMAAHELGYTSGHRAGVNETLDAQLRQIEEAERRARAATTPTEFEALVARGVF